PTSRSPTSPRHRSAPSKGACGWRCSGCAPLWAGLPRSRSRRSKRMADRERLPPGGTGDEELEGTVAAYLLGALPPAEARAFQRELAHRPAAARLLAEWRPVLEVL